MIMLQERLVSTSTLIGQRFGLGENAVEKFVVVNVRNGWIGLVVVY